MQVAELKVERAKIIGVHDQRCGEVAEVVSKDEWTVTLRFGDGVVCLYGKPAVEFLQAALTP